MCSSVCGALASHPVAVACARRSHKYPLSLQNKPGSGEIGLVRLKLAVFGLAGQLGHKKESLTFAPLALAGNMKANMPYERLPDIES